MRLHCHLVEQEETREKLLRLLCAVGAALQDTGPAPGRDFPCLFLTLLIYLEGQRDAHEENTACCPRAAWHGMDTDSSSRKKSFLFFNVFVFAVTKS